MSQASVDNMKEWCIGMPLTGQRPLESEERENIVLEEKALRYKGLTAILISPLITVMVMLITITNHFQGKDVHETFFISSLLCMFLLLPASILLSRDSFRRSRRLKQDLDCGIVKQFSGHLHKDLIKRGSVSTLFTRQLSLNGDDEASIEVLSESFRVWKVQGSPAPSWREARTVSIAAQPEIARIAAQWLQPAQLPNGETINMGRRELSNEERAEIIRIAKKIWIRHLPMSAALSVWLVILVTLIGSDGLAHDRTQLMHLWFLAFLTFTMVYRLSMEYRRSRRLLSDERGGAVIIAEVYKDAPASSVSSSPERQEAKKVVVELLSVTRWLWTEDGRPAIWRRMPT